VLMSVMLSTGLVAIDATIVATAVPSIVGNLGGFSQFPWLFSAYLLAQAVSTPIYGKLADLFGRKPVMLFGIAVFLLGSILCGAAWSMPALIAFRALQGLGAGAVQPMAMTIVGDIYTTAERGKVQGYIASVWAVSSVVGPALGGALAEYLSWRWIFFGNVPLCLVAGWALVRGFREQVTRRSHRLDYAGAALLGAGSALLILGLLSGGEAWAWSSPVEIAMLATGAALLGAFVLVERVAPEPVLPLWVFRHRMLVSSTLATVGVGAVLVGLSSYVPTFVQGVLGTGPLVAGFALATMVVGWPITASVSGRVYMRIGFRATAVIGGVLTVLGASLLAVVAAHPSVLAVAAACFLVGAGLGFTASPTLIAAQATVGWSSRGVVTGVNMFGRSMGSAVGVAVFGAVANAMLGAGRTHPPADLARASQQVFVWVAVVAALMTVAVLTMPGGRPEAAPDPAAPEHSPATRGVS
jgi:EmrB/QacA subfamily drug resistance transporter